MQFTPQAPLLICKSANEAEVIAFFLQVLPLEHFLNLGNFLYCILRTMLWRPWQSAGWQNCLSLIEGETCKRRKEVIKPILMCNRFFSE